MKKIMSLCLAVCLVVLCLPLHVSAETITGTCGENLTYTFDTDTGTLTVSGTGPMIDLHDYGSPTTAERYSPRVFPSCHLIKSVIVKPGVTSLGTHAFHNCTNLTEVQLPDSLTQIGAYAFSMCGQLSRLTLPNHLISIEKYAFSSCRSLKEVTLSNAVAHLDPDAFSDCNNLEAIHVGAENQVYSSIDGVLFNKTQDRLLCYPGAKPGTAYTVPDTVTAIAPCAFQSADFEHITLSKPLTELGNAAFGSCSALKEFTLPAQLDTVPDHLLSGCKSLEKVTLHEGVKKIGSGSFFQCTSLTDIKLPDRLESLESYAFSGCEHITELDLPAGLQVLGSCALSRTGISSAVIPQAITEVESDVFSGCKNLKEVTLHDKVTALKWSVFSGCTSLQTIDLPDSLVSMSYYCFAGSGLKEITLPKSLQEIGGYCFKDTALTEITIPKNITYINMYAFQNCTQLKKVEAVGPIQNISTDAFTNCTALETVYLPSSLKQLFSATFETTTNLKDIYFNGPRAQWEVYRIADAMFLPDVTVHCTDGDIHYDAEPYTYFEDVRRGAYFCAAVNWAKENGITLGTSDTEFSPGRSCSRAQIVTFLWRAKGSPDPKNPVSPFSDVQNPEEYFYKPVIWAAENNITLGDGAGRFSPGGDCTRAQMVTFLWRSAGCPAPTNTSHAFTDVDPDAYYYDPMLWAVEQGITVGTTDTTFGPDELCTRAQAVTFLYRAAQV